MERKQDLSWLRNWRVLTVCGGCIFAGFLLGMLIFGSPWHLPPAWGDIPTWITALATAGLFIGAIITASYAIKAFGKQAEEVAILVEQRDRDNLERRIAQAGRVFIALPRNPGWGTYPPATNGSDLPIFDAQFWYSEPGGVSGPDYLGTIRPGDTVHAGQEYVRDYATARAILAFRDAAGVRWIRMPDGSIEEQSCGTARDSVLTALRVELPKPGLHPPGPGSEHNLPTSFSRPNNDVITVHPLSRGILQLPGGFDTRRPHTELYEVKVTSADPGNHGVYIEERRATSPDNPEKYSVAYDIWNYRDDPVTAKITQARTADQ